MQRGSETNENEMAFHQFPSGFSFDPVFSGSCDEGFQKLAFAPDYHRNLCTRPPHLNNALCQNIDWNYYDIYSRNVAHSSFFGEPCRQLPYSNRSVVPNRFESDPWTNVSGCESYVMAPPYNPNQSLNNSLYECYNVQRSLTLPDPAYPSFSCHLDRDCLKSCSANLNQQSDDIQTLNSSSVMASCPQLQHYQRPGYFVQEIGNNGTSYQSAVPHHYSIDEIMQNTVTSSAQLSMFGIESSLLAGDNTQQTTFSNYSSPNQLHVLGQTFEVNDRMDMFSKSGIVDYGAGNACVSKSVAESNQSLTDASTALGAARVLTDCAVDDCGSSRHADCMASSSRLFSSVSETHVSSHIDMISTIADDYLCQATPETPHSLEEPVAFVPYVNASDRYSVGAESSCCSRTSVQRPVSPMQTTMGMSGVSSHGTGEFEVFLKEDEQTGLNSVEMDTLHVASSDAFTANVPPASAAVQFSTDSSKISQVLTAVSSTIPREVNIADREVPSRQELVPEATETVESDTENCSNSSIDVLDLSPLQIACEPTALVSTNPGTDAVKPCPQMQPTHMRGQPNTDCHPFSAVHPAPPKSLPAGLPCVGSHAFGVAHCRSSPLVPLTSHDLSKSRSCYNLRTRAKEIGHKCSIQTTSHQRDLSNSVISCMPTTSRVPICVPNVTTCRYVKPMIHQPPNTVTFRSLQTGHRHSVQKQHERLLHGRQSYVLDILSESRTCNFTAGNNDHCNELKNLRHIRFQKPMHMASQHFPQHGVAQRNASQGMNSTSSSRILRISTANLVENHSAYHRPQFLLRRQGSSPLLVQQASVRKHGTYCVRAANVLLQRLGQARLSNSVSSHTARQQQLLNRSLSSLSQVEASEVPDIIDLTDDNEENTVETCEHVFARTRRRLAGIRLLHQPRQNFLRRNSMAHGSSCNLEYQPTKKAFAIDRSLPFYRCFVQKLLRNFRFSSGGVPAKVYPALPEIMPPALPSTAVATRGAHNKDHSSIYKELLKKRQPVVALKKLDQSILNKYGSIKIKALQSSVCALAASPRIELENCVPRALNASGDEYEKSQSCDSHDKVSVSKSWNAVDTTFDQAKEETDQKETVATKTVGCEFGRNDNVRDSQNGVDTYDGQNIEEFDRSEEDNIQKENMAVKLTANGQQRYDKLVSLCRPVSVVLEHVDDNKIHNSCRDLLDTGTCHQDSKQIAQLETELPDSYHSWTVFQIPRANKVPILIIRTLPSSSLNTSGNKVSKKASKCGARFARKCTSKYLRNRDHTAGIQRLRNFAPHCSEWDNPRRKISKKMPGSQKLHSAHSLSMSLRSSRILRSSHRSVPLMRPACRISAKCSRKQTKLPSKLLVNRTGSGTRVHSKITGRLHKRESLVTPVNKDMRLVLLDSTSKNDLPTTLLPYDSDSNTVELTPNSPLKAITSVDHALCFAPSDSAQNSTLSCNLLTCDSVVHRRLSDDHESSDSDTIVMSSADVIDSVDPDVSFSLTSKNALTADWSTCHGYSEDLAEGCELSDSDTIVLSRQSSMDDLTIAYRSPLCDLLDSDEPLLDQQEQLGGNLEADISGTRCNLKTLDSDQESKPSATSDVAASTHIGVNSGSYTAGSLQFSCHLVESCALSESLNCGLITSNIVDSERLQPTPLQLIGSVNDGPEMQDMVNRNLSEFVDNDQKRHGITASLSVEVVVGKQ